MEIKKAMGDLMRIHNDEMAALLKGDFTELDRLRETLSAARANKADKINEYREHVTLHHC